MIEQWTAERTEIRLSALAPLLVDAVAHGASVNFLAGFGREESEAFWRKQISGLRDGTTHLLVASAEGQPLGHVLLFLAAQSNAPFRAEIGKMIVHSSARRFGLGRDLLAAVEALALSLGRTLLLLDTESGSAGDALYRAAGWVEYGRVPDHALRPDGVPAETTMFYKRLAPAISAA